MPNCTSREVTNSSIPAASISATSQETSSIEETPSPILITPTGHKEESSLESSPVTLRLAGHTTLVHSPFTPIVNASSTTAVNISTPHIEPCTGCVIQAYPITRFYDKNDGKPQQPWTSIIITETVIVEYITWMVGTSVDTVVSETRTLNQTTTVTGSRNQTITYSTPMFTITPTRGVYLT
ncbi:hypothetical protein P153DRAFT_313179, partial [Dothidotthia symphoricarpi CBS 119687]